MTGSIVLAVDGGNSKTDLALVHASGALLAHVRGPLSSPHHLGLTGCLDLLQSLLDQAVADAGLDDSRQPVAEVGAVYLAGVDFPAEEERLHEAVTARNWAAQVSIGNDTFAVLRAGTERGWGVAVVCGAGINCVGVGPDGRHVRFPALGAITGDWGGGYDVGLAALSAAARSQDGRGPHTTLERAVPGFFDVETPLDVAEAIHLRRISERRLIELAPIVLAEARRDDVAAEIVNRLADEVVALASVALAGLGLDGEATEVVLGGGLMRNADGRLLAAIERGLEDARGAVTIRTAASPPIVGAALLGLDELAAGVEAAARVRRELGAAIDPDEELEDTPGHTVGRTFGRGAVDG